MKKLVVFVLVAIMVVSVFALSACSSEPEAAATETSESTEPAAEGGKTLKFGEIAHDRGIEWVNYGVQNFEYACEQMGVEPVVVDAQNDMEKVLSGMEDLLAQGVDAVSVYSFSPDLDARVAQMARDAGIPIVFENAVPDDSVDRDSVTCCTYYDIGYAVTNMIADQFPGAKFIYIMGQPGMNITEPYNDGIADAIKDGADCEMVASYPTNWTAEEAMSATQDAIQSGVEFSVIFANNEQIAQGVLQALDQAELKGEIPVIATGGSPAGIDMLKSGDLFGTLAAPTSYMGALSAKKLMDLVNGKSVEEMTFIPLLAATSENIDEIIPWTPGEEVIKAIGGLE